MHDVSRTNVVSEVARVASHVLGLTKEGFLIM